MMRDTKIGCMVVLSRRRRLVLFCDSLVCSRKFDLCLLFELHAEGYASCTRVAGSV
jgi:hypothetical protein